LVEEASAKIREYIEHRQERETQVLAALESGVSQVVRIVKIIYAAYPESLHAAAGQSVTSHLQKLEAEGRVRRESGDAPGDERWRLG
jgi:hypothetical protein